MAGAISAPLAQTDRIVVINSSTDGAGTSKVTEDVTNIIAQVPTTIEALTGIDLVAALQGLPGVRDATDGSGAQEEELIEVSEESEAEK